MAFHKAITMQAHLRITADLLERLKTVVFARYPQKEWAIFLIFGFRRTKDALVLTAVDLITPDDGDLNDAVPIVQFGPQYSVRAALTVEKSPFCIGVVHSHPEDYRPSPSNLDDDMDGYYTDYFQGFTKSACYCSLIFALKKDGTFVFSGRGTIDGQAFQVTRIIAVGRDSISRLGPAPRSTRSAVTERMKQVYGSEARERLHNSFVTIAGVGGTGSVVAHILARAGVQQFVLIDHDRFEDSNLERLHGSTDADVRSGTKRHKVEIVRDLILSINPNAVVVAIVGNILQSLPRDYAVASDLAFCCTDTAHSRVGLSDLAYRYLLPVIDIGVQLEGENGKVRAEVGQFTMYSPDLPCIYCRGRIDHRQLSVELMPEEEREARKKEAKEAAERGDDADQYWLNLPVLHTVGHLTTLAAALAATYGIGWLTGKFRAPATLFQFDLLDDNLGYVPIEMEKRSGCSCATKIGYADQGSAYTLVSAPTHWPEARLL
jgi:molybdopterin-synthase adenylyltransferase